MANNGKRRVVTGDSSSKTITVTRKNGTVKKQKTISNVGNNGTMVDVTTYKRKPSGASKKEKGFVSSAEVDGSVFSIKNTGSKKKTTKDNEVKKVKFTGKGTGANNPIKRTKTTIKYTKK